ncbi:PilW family protein [Denitromonas iodatirespirans]|uniref:PilW family protein n=1 Tax=Denitromonas iodatirespirans TaxID=2795389 RepID=A0A944DEE2_DENI1|nr:PilW family protein [Denitromonas iodatirespirans]MBT0964002.1 PilW family protein [Denitromonas iodatirespirans]
MSQLFYTTFGGQRRQQGLSLIEVMVGMLIGLFILGGMVTLFFGNQQTYRYNEELSRLQENSRFATEILQRHLRMAGHVGCLTLQEINGGSPISKGESIVDSPQIQIEGMTAVQAFQYSAASPGVVGDAGKTAVLGSDVVTLRYGQGASTTLDTDTGVPTKTPSIVIRDNALGFKQGEVIVMADCKTAGLARISNTPASGNSVALEFKKATNYNLKDGFDGITFASDLRIMRMANVSFFIGPSTERITNRQGNAFNSLYLASEGFNGRAVADEIIEGVVDMVVEYGVPNASGSDEADAYKPLASITDWNDVRAVKVTLLLSSVDDKVVSDAQSVTFNGNTYTDHRMYTTVSTTVSLRRTF